MCEWEPKTDGVRELFETYYMNELYKADVEDPTKLILTRNKFHEIIAWGCCDRMGETQKVMNKIYNVEQATFTYLHQFRTYIYENSN